VQSLQRAVVAFVQAPVLRHRDPELIHLVERDAERLDRPREHGRERAVELEPGLLHQPARLLRFGASLVGEIDVLPPGETVFEIPGGLAVSQEHDFVHGAQRLTAASALRPAYVARLPSSSSIRSSWLYFATRSERLAEPVLICPEPVATARSAIVVSSVSP